MEQRPRPNRFAWLVACAVVLGWGINFVLAKHALNQFSVGLSYTSAFSASLLLALVPIWVAIFSSALARKPPPATSLLALGLAAGGTALFVGTRTSVSLGWGDAIALIVSALYATYLLLNRDLVSRFPPFTLTTYAASIAAIPVLISTAPSVPRQDWAAVTVGGWLAMAWVIVGPVFVAWSLWNWVFATSHRFRSLHSCSRFQ